MFPALFLAGPRQSGKTTFLKNEFGKEHPYVTFDDPLMRDFARNDPLGFLGQFGKRSVILDEVQNVPELFSYLKMAIDNDRTRMGRFLLTGSQQFSTLKNLSDSLAGRVAIFELLPFTVNELPERDLDNLVWNGGYPEVALNPEKRDLWVKSYIQTYFDRDVRQLQNIRDLRSFESFVGLAAAYHGQELNLSRMASACGISVTTAKAWISVLQSCYLIYLLAPYVQNFGKRLVKAPKLYFLDSALLTALTRQPNATATLAGPAGGAVFEGLVIAETVKAFFNKGLRPNIYFWRSHDGLEVDLLLQIQQYLVPIEVKLSATPTFGHMSAIKKFREICQVPLSKESLVVCRVQAEQLMPHDSLAIPLSKYVDWLWSKLS